MREQDLEPQGAAAVRAERRVSVIVPAFNAERWIADTLESVFAQTYTNYEVIVVDDGSTDRTAAAVSRFAGKLRYSHQAHKGVGAARNAGIAASSGELIAQLDADDMWRPDFLAVLAPLFDDAAVGVACGDIVYWDQQRPLEVCPRHWQRVSKPREATSMWPQLLRENYVPAAAAMVRRSALLRAGPYDERLHYAEDYDMWLRIARLGYRFCLVDTLLGVHRLRPDSLTGDLGAKLDAHLYIGAKWMATPDLTSDERRALHESLRARKGGYRSAAVNCLLAGQRDKARRYFSTAVRYAPLDPRNVLGWALSWVSPGLAARIAWRLRRARRTSRQSIIPGVPHGSRETGPSKRP